MRTERRKDPKTFPGIRYNQFNTVYIKFAQLIFRYIRNRADPLPATHQFLRAPALFMRAHVFPEFFRFKTGRPTPALQRPMSPLVQASRFQTDLA